MHVLLHDFVERDPEPSYLHGRADGKRCMFSSRELNGNQRRLHWPPCSCASTPGTSHHAACKLKFTPTVLQFFFVCSSCLQNPPGSWVRGTSLYRTISDLKQIFINNREELPAYPLGSGHISGIHDPGLHGA